MLANPGNTGAYAFSFIEHARGAGVSRMPMVEVRLDPVGRDRLGRVAGSAIRAFYPVSKRAEVFGSFHADQWTLSEASRQKYALTQKSGVTGGDLVFGSKFQIFSTESNPYYPDLSIKFVYKTTSGDFKKARRYTDTMAFVASVALSQLVYQKNQRYKIFMHTELGFANWDSGVALQNDAPVETMALELDHVDYKVIVSWMGYQGWQKKKLDWVSEIQVETIWKANSLTDGYLRFTKGMSSASVPYLLGIGMRRAFPIPH